MIVQVLGEMAWQCKASIRDVQAQDAYVRWLKWRRDIKESIWRQAKIEGIKEPRFSSFAVIISGKQPFMYSDPMMIECVFDALNGFKLFGGKKPIKKFNPSICTGLVRINERSQSKLLTGVTLNLNLHISR